jgi:hypothetical protein
MMVVLSATSAGVAAGALAAAVKGTFLHKSVF